MAWREGEGALANFLQEYKDGNPSFVLSDGMPGDFLPAPAHMSLMASITESYADYQSAKKLKKVAWLKPDEFEAVREGAMTIQPKARINPFKAFSTMHSSINRLTGTTGDEGSLFELPEYALVANEETISIYLKIRGGEEERTFSLFKDLSRMGYGKKKSIGKGSFEIVGEFEPFEKFDHIDGGNGFISLSNFVPSKDDPTSGFYMTIVKYGKLGGEYAFSEKPFKKPLIMLSAGSAFYVTGAVKPFYGRIVEGIAPAKPAVVQYGYAFAVPVRLAI